MTAPLPLADLLELLQERKIEIGVREHLTVGRLLSRWDDPDPGALRDALAAVLARNPEEVATVRTAFDELYRPPVQEESAPSPPLPERPRERRSRRWIVLAAASAVVLSLVLGAIFWPRPKPPGPQPIASPGSSQVSPEPRPAPPTIPDIWSRPDRNRVLAGAAGIAAGLLLALYRIRLRRAAERAARRRWHQELEELPEPQGYEIELGAAAPPFPPAVLEEAASLLGRRAPTSPRHGDLDVDRTLQRTLRAGLAPHVVFRDRAAAPSVVVLEDIGSEMAPWRGRVSALLAGLAARGVPLDRWQFHADAGRVFRTLGDPEISLRQLARMRAASPLLVLSAGEGVLQGEKGEEGRIAPWIEQLAAWPHRAWLHPVGDPGSWSPVLRRPGELKISLWPMTPEGLLAAARHLAHGRPGAARATWRRAADRPVAALDVDRLRWLLALTPRRDPELLEKLRQEFCPQVPPAAWREALEAPPLAAPLGLPPAAGAVHAFLADLLAASEPEPGTAAHQRWRLDRALQEIRVPERQARALGDLEDLARGPLAGQIGDAVEELTGRSGESLEPPLTGTVARDLRRTVLTPIRRRASQARLATWRRVPPPGWAASAAALLLALLAALALPALSPAFNREEPVRQEMRYELTLIDPQGAGPFRLEARGDAKWRDVPKMLVGSTYAAIQIPGSFELEDSRRGSWYYVRDAFPEEGVLGISNPVWVERRETKDNPPPEPPLVPAPEPPKRSGGSIRQPVDSAGSQDPRPQGTRRVEPGQGVPAGPPSSVPPPSAIPTVPENLWATRTAQAARNILIEQLGVTAEEIRPDARLRDDLRVDDMETVMLALAFENELSIDISYEDLRQLSTVRDLISYLEKDAGPDAGLTMQSLPEQAKPIDERDRRRTTFIPFIEGSAKLSGMALAILDEVAFQLKQEPELLVQITGRSNNRESQTPRTLANYRARSVRGLLMSRHNIDSYRIRIAVYLESETDEEGMSAVVEFFSPNSGLPE